MIPSFTSENAKTASGAATDDVGARDEPGASAERVALHPRDDGRGAAVDSLEHRPQRDRVGDVLLVAQVDRDRIHSTSAPEQKLGPSPASTTARAVADVDERLGQLLDERGVERVPPFRARQRDAQHVAVAFDAERGHRA